MDWIEIREYTNFETIGWLRWLNVCCVEVGDEREGKKGEGSEELRKYAHRRKLLKAMKSPAFVKKREVFCSVLDRWIKIDGPNLFNGSE